MMGKDLSRLLRPRSIAVIGGGWSERVVEQCRQMGFTGSISAVHPTKDSIAGLHCYRRVEDLPQAPDASFIGVNRTATIDIVAALAARGSGGAVCFASGFREVADGDALNDQLIAAAGNMPILGPNCYGFINYLEGALLWPDQHGGQRVTAGVAIITQSSNIAINLTMQSRGLPIAYVLTVGNQAQTSMAELIEAVLDDPRVTAIGLHIEGFDSIPAVERAFLNAWEKRIAVVALKVGESEAAQAMTLSHTASLAGADNLVSAFFERMNVARVKSLDEMLEALKILHILGASPDATIGSLSCSGGEASMMGDLAQAAGLDIRPLSESEKGKVSATLSDMVTISNPLDYHTFTWGDRESLTRTYAAMLTCDFGLTCLVLDIPRPDRCVDNGSDAAVLAAIDAVQEVGGRLAIVASLPDNMTEALAGRLTAAGIVPMMGMQAAMFAAAAVAKIGIGFANPRPAPLFVETSAQTKGYTVLDEWQSKSALRDHGIATPKGFLTSDINGAAKAAEQLGYPVVLKAVGSELAHKTELGAVKLNLQDHEGVRMAADQLAKLGAPLLVERMVPNPVAELIIGVARDAQFGLYLTIGAGGVLVELLKDAKVILLPATRDEIHNALLSLQSAPLLTGFRNTPSADLDAILDVALNVADFAMAEGAALEELDINPLLALENGAVAADAFIRKRIV